MHRDRERERECKDSLCCSKSCIAHTIITPSQCPETMIWLIQNPAIVEKILYPIWYITLRRTWQCLFSLGPFVVWRNWCWCWCWCEQVCTPGCTCSKRGAFSVTAQEARPICICTSLTIGPPKGIEVRDFIQKYRFLLIFISINGDNQSWTWKYYIY